MISHNFGANAELAALFAFTSLLACPSAIFISYKGNIFDLKLVESTIHFMYRSPETKLYKFTLAVEDALKFSTYWHPINTHLKRSQSRLKNDYFSFINFNHAAPSKFLLVRFYLILYLLLLYKIRTRIIVKKCNHIKSKRKS